MTFLGSRIPLLALTATLCALGAFWSVLSRSDELIGESYAKALSTETRLVQAPASAQSEADLLHLSSAPAGLPFGLTRPVARGDRITISGRDGQARSLEITDVRPLDTRAGGGASGVLLVTCKVAGEPETAVRFIIESAAPDAALTPRLHRAL
jgi:hypothetical protein